MEQFTFIKRGYDPEEVDKYISTLEQVIKSYKDKDNAIKNAIISAQRTAEDVVKNAQAEAETYKAQMGEQLVGMRGALDRQRASLQNFQDMNANAIRKCIQELERFDMSEMFARIDEMDAAIAALQGLETINKDRLLQSQNIDQRMDSRGYSRDTLQDSNVQREPEPREREYGYPRESSAMRDAGRDPMRMQGSAAPYDGLRDRDTRGNEMERAPRDIQRDTGMDMMRQRAPQEPVRDALGREQAPQEYMPPMRGTGRDMMAREPYAAPQDTMRDRDMMGRDGGMPQYASQQASNEVMRDTGRDMMPSDSRDLMRAPSREYAPESQREIIPGTRRDSRNDFGRDIRRDYGRDIRSDTGRDTRRDDYMRDGMGRLDGREPMRDMNRQYAPDADSYDDHDQNLLPPVASLM